MIARKVQSSQSDGERPKSLFYAKVASDGSWVVLYPFIVIQLVRNISKNIILALLVRQSYKRRNYDQRSH